MKLDRLPNHITGFFDDKSEPACPLDVAEFKAACFQVARMAGGTVTDFDHDLTGKSFFTATIRTPEGHTAVLCNCAYPYITFVPAGSETYDTAAPAFSRPEPLTTLFRQATAFHPLDTDWLLCAPDEYLLSSLASAEQAQVRHWKPERIGDIIFNHWD